MRALKMGSNGRWFTIRGNQRNHDGFRHVLAKGLLRPNGSVHVNYRRGKVRVSEEFPNMEAFMETCRDVYQVFWHPIDWSPKEKVGRGQGRDVEGGCENPN